MNGDLSVGDRQASPDDLANQLSELGYIGLFQQADEGALESIWNTPGAPGVLETLALSPQAPMLPRFLATEVLFYKEGPRLEEQKLARVYAAALANNFTETANPWGLPGVLEGLAGEHLLAIGEPMVPELLHLLDNDQRVYYEGSKEATLGHHHGYRVKDLAAYYISKIRHIPFEMDEDPRERDQKIEMLKDSLQ